MSGTPVFLSNEALEALNVTPLEAVGAIERAVRAQTDGRLRTAPKSALLPPGGRYVMTTLATCDAPDLTVVKCVTVAPDNPDHGLAAIQGSIMALSSRTGGLLAVLDAGWVTAVRTAALSATVAKRIANPEAATIGFVGCGVQARSHLDAFNALFPLKSVKAFGRGAANRDRFVEYARAQGLRAEAADAEETISTVDLVVTSVTLDYSIKPFLDASLLKPGAFAAITDLGIPWRPESLGAVETIVIDDRIQEAESEKKMVPPEAVRADLQELVSGAIDLSFNAEKRAAFIFRGLAIGDFALTELACARANLG